MTPSIINQDVLFCRVLSDPQSEVAWFFKGARINATVEPRPEEGEGGDGRQVRLLLRKSLSLGRRFNGFQGLSLNDRTNLFPLVIYWIGESRTDKTVFALRRLPNVLVTVKGFRERVF